MHTLTHSTQTMWDFAAAHTDARWLWASTRLTAPDSGCAVGDAIGRRCAAAGGVGDGSCARGVAEIDSNPADRYLACRQRRTRMVATQIASVS